MGSLPAGADRFAIGWHPTQINDFFCPNKGYAFRSKFVQCLSLERCIAVGEVGIDYERERNPERRLQQEELLACMVEKAKLAKKPLLLHMVMIPKLHLLHNSHNTASPLDDAIAHPRRCA